MMVNTASSDTGIDQEHQYDFVWPTLYPGRLIKRYERFKADIILKNGRLITAHCPNSGSMKGCSEPERPVYVSRSNNPKRKFPYTWEIIQMPSSPVVINTLTANHIVKNAILHQKIAPLTGYETLRTEVPYGQGSRIDILLENHGQRCLVEIKSCTMVKDGMASFPDAPTLRGRKHLKELARSLNGGTRSIIFYLIQRMDTNGFVPACSIDPAYCQELIEAVNQGVEMMAYDVKIDNHGIFLNRKLDIL